MCVIICGQTGEDVRLVGLFVVACRGDEKSEGGDANGSGPGRPKSKMEMIIEQEKAAAAAKASKAAANTAAAAAGAAAGSSSKRIPWLLPGLVVKVGITYPPRQEPCLVRDFLRLPLRGIARLVNLNGIS